MSTMELHAFRGLFPAAQGAPMPKAENWVQVYADAALCLRVDRHGCVCFAQIHHRGQCDFGCYGDGAGRRTFPQRPPDAMKEGLSG